MDICQYPPRVTRWLAVPLLNLWALVTVNSYAGMMAFVGATVIEGTGADPKPNAVVLVDGERIAVMGSRDQMAIPEEVQVIEASGKWITPGLIDAHVHFFQSGSLYTRPDVIDLRDIRPYKQKTSWIRQRLPNTFAHYLASGVTVAPLSSDVLESQAPPAAWNHHCRWQ